KAAAKRAVAECRHILLVEDILRAGEEADRIREMIFGAQVDESIGIEAYGVGGIVEALARPPQRGAKVQTEGEGVANRGVGAVARTARQPLAEIGRGTVLGDDPAIIAVERQPTER